MMPSLDELRHPDVWLRRRGLERVPSCSATTSCQPTWLAACGHRLILQRTIRCRRACPRPHTACWQELYDIAACRATCTSGARPCSGRSISSSTRVLRSGSRPKATSTSTRHAPTIITTTSSAATADPRRRSTTRQWTSSSTRCAAATGSAPGPRGARFLRHVRGLRGGTHRPLSAQPVAVCAPNAFKGTLSARAAARALALGVRDAEGTRCRASCRGDGGDGTLDVLACARTGSTVTRHRAMGPTGPTGHTRTRHASMRRPRWLEFRRSIRTAARGRGSVGRALRDRSCAPAS